MTTSPTAISSDLAELRDLTARIGSDRSLTQASTGNSSAKIGGDLWIKRSGCWMSAALRDDIFVRLDLGEIRRCLSWNLDPSQFFAGASLETAMHALMPHRIVLHVHSVSCIAWAVRADALPQLETRLAGLRWQWIPYLPSGLPLAVGIERACAGRMDTDLLVLANHGLVIGGEDVRSVDALLSDVQRRLDTPHREPRAADHPKLAGRAVNSVWRLPDDEEIHSLAIDPLSRRIVSEGILYPCHAIFAGPDGLEAFRAIDERSAGAYRHSQRPFLFLDGCGVLVNESAGAATVAMLSGLAQVASRLDSSAPIRYLSDTEISTLSPEIANRYRTLANAAAAPVLVNQSRFLSSA